MKTNKLTEGVFSKIVGTPKEISTYDRFINLDIDADLNVSKDSTHYLNLYRTLINEYKTKFEKLARLEELIMTIRAKENIQDIKLSLVREYIYARAVCFRDDTQNQDIRVIVGYTEFDGTDLDALYSNEVFMENAKAKIAKYIDNMVDYKKKTFTQIF
jgi:hypothetical protein